tara:strand:- start:580 stop:765 length:186 start_codon:yes stop_codon:yes gene_type:complete
MGEAKRRKKLGLPPKNINKDSNKRKEINKLNSFLNKYPYSPYIFGFVLITILIIDLINYYK